MDRHGGGRPHPLQSVYTDRHGGDVSPPPVTNREFVLTTPDGNYPCPNFRAFNNFRAFIVHSKVPMARLQCVENCLCPDYLVFKNTYVQTFVRSKFFPDRVMLNARRLWVLSYQTVRIDFGSLISAWV